MDIHEWLNATAARDIMTSEVAMVKATDSLHEAAEFLAKQQISGAPVIDDNGNCVGVITTSDFLGVESDSTVEQRKQVKSSFYDSRLFLHSQAYARDLDVIREKVAATDGQTVQDIMTTDVVSVDDDDRVSTVIQYMIDAHIHRVLVLDADGQLQGIVSSTDVLADLMVSNQKAAI